MDHIYIYIGRDIGMCRGLGLGLSAFVWGCLSEAQDKTLSSKVLLHSCVLA